MKGVDGGEGLWEKRADYRAAHCHSRADAHQIGHGRCAQVTQARPSFHQQETCQQKRNDRQGLLSPRTINQRKDQARIDNLPHGNRRYVSRRDTDENIGRDSEERIIAQQITEDQ